MTARFTDTVSLLDADLSLIEIDQAHRDGVVHVEKSRSGRIVPSRASDMGKGTEGAGND